jgi:hypothetical protein
MRVRSSIVRVCLAALVALLSGAQQARAQEGGVPQERTIAELRQDLAVFQAFGRQLAMFGLPPLGGEEVLKMELLKAEFDENVMPGLRFAEQDCFMAEVPVANALSWARQVQLLGFVEDYGPLWEEADVIQESVGRILVNCHKQLYERCVMDDGDPNVIYLPGITRELSLFGFEGDYEQKTRRCEIGWLGKVTITESLQGSLSKTDSMGGTSVSTSVVFSGSRNFKVEMITKGNATGTADGRSQETTTTVARAGQCTTTMDQTGLRTTGGDGEAFLRKVSTETGKLLISFSGPRETGRSSTTGSIRFSDSKCGQNGNLPDAGAPTPPHPWPGQIADTLGDPFSEVITGSKSLTFVGNAAGALVPAQDNASGGVSRIPAIPGMPRPGAGLDAALPSESQLLPWLEMITPRPDLDGEPPVVRMQVEWELVFGGGV